MNRFGESRALRLERLESRSLLAGGIFHTVFSVEMTETEPPAPSFDHGSPRTRDDAPSWQLTIRIGFPPVDQFSQQPAASAPSVSEPVFDGSSFREPLPNADLESSPRPDPVPSQEMSRRTDVIDVALANFDEDLRMTGDLDPDLGGPPDELDTETRQTTSWSNLDEFPIGGREQIVRSADAAQGTDIGRTLTEPNALDPTDWALDAGSEALDGKLERDSIPFAHHTADQNTTNHNATIHPMTRDGSRGSGGLISLDRIELPVDALSLDETTIDTKLESSVSLHRSLFSESNVGNQGLSEHVLDTIMASLEHVAAADAQPVTEPSHLRVPSAIYTSVTVVAATLALMAHRNHKHPRTNLQFTKE